MAKLITPAQYTRIFKALRDVRDTFDTKPIVYMLATGESMDKWQEDRVDTIFTSYNLLAFLEYSTDTEDELKEQEEGAYSQQQATITMGREYLEEKGLVDPTTLLAIFSDEADYFMVGTVKYKVASVVHDGLLDGKFVNVMVTGNIDNNYNVTK